MDMSPTLAAQLAALTLALGEPGDLEATVRALAHHVKTAITSYLGMTVAVIADGYRISFTVREDSGPVPAVAASIRIPFDGGAGPDAGSSLVLYAAAPDAFVDLAADLSYAWGLRPGMIAIDSHLVAPPAGSDMSGLSAHRSINQAIGILVDEGHTVASAREELNRLADRRGGDLQDAAQRVLARAARPPNEPTGRPGQ